MKLLRDNLEHYKCAKLDENNAALILNAIIAKRYNDNIKYDIKDDIYILYIDII